MASDRSPTIPDYVPQTVISTVVADAVYVLGSQIRTATEQQPESQANGPSEYPLLKAMAFMSDSALANYLIELMNVQEAGYDPDEIRLQIFRGDRKIHSSERGQYEVDIILIDTRMLRNKLPYIVRWAENRDER